MHPAIQVSCEIQVELTRFYNVDLFHRGYYQVRVSIDSQNRDRRVQLSLDRSSEQNHSEIEPETQRRGSRARRTQFPVLPASIASDGQSAISKTFLILYKQETITLNDCFKFHVDFLQGLDSIEDNFVKAGVTLKVDLFYADEDEPPDELSLRNALLSVAQRTVRVNADLRNGLHSYIPLTFDYYHLSTVCINVHATLLSIQRPTFRVILPGEASQNGNAQTPNQNQTQVQIQPITDSSSESFDNVLFNANLISNSTSTTTPNGAASDAEKRDRHLRASERYNEMCTLLLGAQESLRRQLFELRRLVPNALDVRTSSSGLAARLEAMCEAVQVAANENELVEVVSGDLVLLAAEIAVLWTHYMAIVTLNPLVTQYYAVRYQQQRVRRLAEGFLTTEYRKQQLFDPRERSVMSHDEMAEMIRGSSYFQTVLPMALECAEMDGTSSTMPIIFEEVFIDDEEVLRNGALLTVISDSQSQPAPASAPHSKLAAILPGSVARMNRPAAFISASVQLTQSKREPDSQGVSSLTADSEIRMVRSASASKTSLQSSPSASGSLLQTSHPRPEALSDTEAEARGDHRADLIRIAHATTLRAKQEPAAADAENGSVSGSGSGSGSDSVSDEETSSVPLVTVNPPLLLADSNRSASKDQLGIMEMLDEAASSRNVTAEDILASRSLDQQRIDYLHKFEQRAQLAAANQTISLASQPPSPGDAPEESALPSNQSPSRGQPQRSIVATVPDRLVRFIRLKEEFKRRLAPVYSGHLCSDQAFVAATCPYYWAPPSSSKLLAPQPPTDPGLHLVVCVHGMDGFAHDLRSARVALEQSLPATRFDFLLSKRNQRETSLEFDVLGERLVSEILQHIDARGAMPARISFIGFSMGNVIIRTALSSPGLRHLLPKLHTFLSLAGPHLGVLYQTSTIVGVGTWLVRKWKKSESLMQLCLKDHADLRQTFIYRLSRCAGLALFRYVLLVSSPQDHYVPRHSARLELAANVIRDSSELGRVYVEMLANLLSPLAASSRTQLVRYDTVFALPNDTNAFIGRAAHCAVMENELFLEKFFTVSAAKYFR